MKVLIATDGSRAGAAALKFASKLAVPGPGCELVVLTVVSGNGASRGSATAGARTILAGAARFLGNSGREARFQVVSTRRADEVPDVISREADRLKADLIVVGSEGRDSLDEWIVGGTALRLIYVARRPVTVVRAPRRRKTG